MAKMAAGRAGGLIATQQRLAVQRGSKTVGTTALPGVFFLLVRVPFDFFLSLSSQNSTAVVLNREPKKQIVGSKQDICRRRYVMTNRRNRKSQLRRSRRNRVVRQIEGDQTHIFCQTSSKGYDVEMIRDFLEHLLLEVRVQHYENLKGLQIMEKHGDVKILEAATDEIVSPALEEQLGKYVKKYETRLICMDVTNGENATQDEIDIVVEATLGAGKIKRDEQIGHLEALQELFDEVLMCAKVPFGVLSDGSLCRPTRVTQVREAIDQMNWDDESLQE